MGSYTGGHNTNRPQIDKRKTMKNRDRSAALAGGGGGGGGLLASTSLRSTNPRP